MESALCEKVLKDISEGAIYFEDTIQLFEEMQNESIKKRYELADRIYSEIGKDISFDIYIYSFLIQLKPSTKYLDELCLLVLQTDKLDWKQINFIYGQISYILFIHSELYNFETVELHWKILYKAYKMCKEEMNLELDFIPQNQRNQDLAVVITEQFLAEQHGPTKTVLDRCYILQRKMRKKVLIINTTESVSTEGAVPFFDSKCGVHNRSLLENRTVSWKGEEFQYYQCENRMPNIEEMCSLIGAVQRLKPSIIVGVGATGLLSGFINEMIPMLNIGVNLSGIECTLVDYQLVDYNMLDAVKPLINAMGKDMSHIIPEKFTFSLKEQTEFLTRAELGIDDNAFVMAVVGGRLDAEMDEPFISFLNDTLRDDMLVVIIGKCESLENKLSKYPELQRFILNLGFCNDVLSRLELCDLYINPIRRGGGTSAVEAMFKGKPVITVNYGDVATVVGDRFVCENYTEMGKLIERYYEDKKFYEQQSQFAREMADICMNSNEEFVRIMKEYEKRMKRK